MEGNAAGDFCPLGQFQIKVFGIQFLRSFLLVTGLLTPMLPQGRKKSRIVFQQAAFILPQQERDLANVTCVVQCLGTKKRPRAFPSIVKQNLPFVSTQIKCEGKNASQLRRAGAVLHCRCRCFSTRVFASLSS